MSKMITSKGADSLVSTLTVDNCSTSAITTDSCLSTCTTRSLGITSAWKQPNSLQVDDKFFGKPTFLPGTFVYRDKEKYIKRVSIERVTYSNPATIVFWNDGTKTVAKCAEGDIYSAEAGLVICILKKLCGGVGLHNTLDAWLPANAAATNKPVIRTLKDVRKKLK